MCGTADHNIRCVLPPTITITKLPVLDIEPLTVPSPGTIRPEARGTPTADTCFCFSVDTLLDTPVNTASRNQEIPARGLVFEHLAPKGQVSGGVEGAQTAGVELGSLSRGRDGDGGAEDSSRYRVFLLTVTNKSSRTDTFIIFIIIKISKKDLDI